mmetsp:Transcript_21712/g.39856  ORF Transcript_21712/g.39856 Transcript_21712/m.39856 type:complete len:363 (+) Transcript_21712:47-1135(+)
MAAAPTAVAHSAAAGGAHHAPNGQWAVGGPSSRQSGSLNRGNNAARPPSIGRSGAAVAGRALIGAPPLSQGGGACSSGTQPSMRSGSGSMSCGAASEELKAGRVPSRNSSNGPAKRTASGQLSNGSPYMVGDTAGGVRACAGGDILSQILLGDGTQSGSLAAPRRGPASGHSELDFDEEARKLWARLNLDPNAISGGQYNALDPIWRHPSSGATLYVGNQTAAKSLALLQQHHITNVVNCTDSMPLYHDQPGSPIRYYRFDITSYRRRVSSDDDAVAFVQPMLEFVTPALEAGQCVMVHCLAGAHRAGTTGIICLMNFARLNARDAIIAAKRCRPIIDPIGDFPELLRKLERGWKATGRSFS